MFAEAIGSKQNDLKTGVIVLLLWYLLSYVITVCVHVYNIFVHRCACEADKAECDSARQQLPT